MEKQGLNKNQKEYKFWRPCKLDECKKFFGTNRENQKFCEPDHRDRYHNQRRRDVSRITKKMESLDKEVQELRESLDGISATNRNLGKRIRKLEKKDIK